jgi:inositol phosphorylceramide mannosyltransferase catalytic subunit
MVPATFHQIWINRSRPELPSEYARYRDSWLIQHPHWSYRLWNLDNLDFKLQRPELIAQCGSYAQLADLLRLEVLFHHGGVYVDTDFECFRSIEPLLTNVTACACYEKPGVMSNAFLGAQAGSPVIEHLLQALPDRIGIRQPNLETGPAFLSRALTGHDLTVFPTEFFYPYMPGEPRATAQTHPQAYAAHHWALSWYDPQERRLLRRVRTKLKTWLGLRARQPLFP